LAASGAVNWIDRISAGTLRDLDEFDSVALVEELTWRLARLTDLETCIAMMTLATQVVPPTPADVREIAEPIAQRVVELLNEEALVAPLLVDAAHAARLLGITEDAFRTRLQRGQVPRGAIVRTGGRVQFRPERLVRDR